ncbi:Glucosamine kinase GspK [Pelagimonas phthalicica]|uniref:Glucosamine kinase GspK n=1 Tax=Pelagimonas phthalicica TaxID=1037362 RepID=A0A238J8D8_9RHOB|nr:BadF/BadG/BcrA/BcrD ATPase family protein [Pelagimonas phthalicica]TDS94858.1 glucosamine kinase [Pelagimonas phthalicica]SMX26613.1 Glucosamine kinase GspK [Pelagimonas phthalicica]
MTTIPDVIAIDGGGSRCRVACEINGARVVVETGSSNVSTDLAEAVNSITQGLVLLASEINLPVETLHSVPAYLGLAGVTGDEKAQEVAAALPFATCKIEEDRMPALNGALDGQDGALMHCGTGSFQAVQIDGSARFAGGWGAILGDEASSQWVGRKALSATLAAQEGLQAGSALTEAILAKFGNAADIIAFAGQADAADFGALAPMVTQAAETADPIAHEIMQDGTDIIADALRQMGWQAHLPLTYTGGIAPHFATFLPQDMKNNLTAPKGSPLDGAFALAQSWVSNTDPQG